MLLKICIVKVSPTLSNPGSSPLIFTLRTVVARTGQITNVPLSMEPPGGFDWQLEEQCVTLCSNSCQSDHPHEFFMRTLNLIGPLHVGVITTYSLLFPGIPWDH